MGAFNMTTAKYNISECITSYLLADTLLMVSFTRFGAHTDPVDDDINDDCSDNDYANGDIFLTASSDFGETWGPDPFADGVEGDGTPWNTGTAVDLTNTWTDDCNAPGCLSEHWSSMAKYSVDSVHIQYIEDKDAGASIRTDPQEGEPTENNVVYMTYPCFRPEEVCALSIRPVYIGHPLFISPNVGCIDPTGPTTLDVTFTITNTGNKQASDYNIATTAGWITPASQGGTVDAGCNNTAQQTFMIGPIATEGTFVSSFTFTGCTGGVNEEVPVLMHCYCDFYLPEYEKLSTNCWSVGVWNEPRAGLAQRDDEGNMFWFDDSATMMYDEGLVVTMCYDTTVTWFSIYEGSDSNTFFESRSELETSSTGQYEYAKGEFSNHDPMNDPVLRGTIEYYLPIHPDTCVMVECVKLWNASDELLCINVGEGIDWDIDPDNLDYAGEDVGRGMIYQYGCPGFEHENDYGGAKFCNGVVGAITLDNPTWVYPNSGYMPAEIGGLLTRHFGYDGEFVDSCEDLSSFYVIEQDIVLQPGDTVAYCMVKASSRTGLGTYENPNPGTLRDLIDKGCAWASTNVLCYSPCVPGDANGSGNIDIDDVVYLIAYIFGGGPAPVPYLCCGDANASCNIDIDDAVYLISYIFGGGPAPVASCSPCMCGIF